MARKQARRAKKTTAKKEQRAKSRPRSARQPAFETQHTRVTAGLSRAIPSMGMARRSTVTHAGKTAHFDVYYLTRLGKKGAALAQAILQNCERDYGTLQQIFGGLTPARLPFVVQVTAGSTGASHSSCLGTDISVGGSSGGDVDFIRSLLVAEADEVFMANFGKGWDCGASPGEGLSRVLANDIYQDVEPAGFISSNVWLNSRPRPNWVDDAKSTDTDYPSIGCSVLFLNWLRFQLKHTWEDIVAGGGATLADTYNSLTGKDTAWQDFSEFMDAKFPPGKRYNLKTDNPFPV
jgi:hypothetical protein